MRGRRISETRRARTWRRNQTAAESKARGARPRGRGLKRVQTRPSGTGRPVLCRLRPPPHPGLPPIARRETGVLPNALWGRRDNSGPLRRILEARRPGSSPGKAGDGHDDEGPRHSRKKARPTGIARSVRFCLDKIRNTIYVLLLAESLPARRRPGRGRRSRGCLTTCLTTTLARAGEAREFPYFNRL